MKSLLQWLRSLKQFIAIAFSDFAHIASLFPSSRYAAKSLSKHVRDGAKLVIEYGPGNGIITRALLEKIHPSGRLVCIEVNPEFASQLRAIEDPRLIVVEGDVVEHSERLREFAPHGADAVISGIPFSFLLPKERERIVQNTRQVLKGEGQFVVYQNSMRISQNLGHYFRRVKLFFEPRNILPYFIFVATR